MKKKTSYITLCGIISALSASLMLVSYFPYLTYAVPAVAGMLMIVPLAVIGKRYAFLSYIVSAVIVAFSSETEAKLLFIAFFGYYPILKALLEKIKFRAVEYLLKLLVFNGAISLVYFLFAKLFGVVLEDIEFNASYSVAVLYIFANAVFILYDSVLAKMSNYYLLKIHPKLKKIMKL